MKLLVAREMALPSITNLGLVAFAVVVVAAIITLICLSFRHRNMLFSNSAVRARDQLLDVIPLSTVITACEVKHDRLRWLRFHLSVRDPYGEGIIARIMSYDPTTEKLHYTDANEGDHVVDYSAEDLPVSVADLMEKLLAFDMRPARRAPSADVPAAPRETKRQRTLRENLENSEGANSGSVLSRRGDAAD